MGILRVYLALCVIASHANDSVFPWQMHDGRQAVQIFYMISGFYMAMVLSTRYAKPADFYRSRLLRIFPPYWITLILTGVLCTATGLIFHQWLLLTPYLHHPGLHNGLTGVVLTAATNLSLLGQDWIMFLSQGAGEPLHFTANFGQDAAPLWRYLLVPQSWSVGVELTFYAVAPYLNRLRSRWLVLIAALALAARLFAYSNLGAAFDPWTYRFFPFELSVFLLGMLGYRFFLWTKPYHPAARFRCISRPAYVLGALVLLALLNWQLHAVKLTSRWLGDEGAVLLLYPLWALVIPTLFFVFGSQKDDRRIGELSYPIYLVHVLVLSFTYALFTRLGTLRGLGAGSALVAIVVSVGFYVWIIRPLDRKRHHLA